MLRKDEIQNTNVESTGTLPKGYGTVEELLGPFPVTTYHLRLPEPRQYKEFELESNRSLTFRLAFLEAASETTQLQRDHQKAN